MTPPIRPHVQAALLSAMPAENVVALMQIGLELHALLRAGATVRVVVERDLLRCEMIVGSHVYVVNVSPGPNDIGGPGVANLAQLLEQSSTYLRTVGVAP